MSLVDTRSLADVQAERDARGVLLQEVGVAGVHLPASAGNPDGSLQATVVDADLTVEVPQHVRGTHMSRFIEAALATGAITPRTVLELARDLRARLQAPTSHAQMRFPLFVTRVAPESGLAAPQRYDAWIRAQSSDAAGEELWVGVRAAVTSLCPCSKEISDYGAHSQRGYIEAEVLTPGWRANRDGLYPQDLLTHLEGAGSATIYPLLKRIDERRVTMDAYDNPAFVEDVAREVVVALRADERCEAWSISVTNHESIHDHQAVARVRGRR